MVAGHGLRGIHHWLSDERAGLMAANYLLGSSNWIQLNRQKKRLIWNLFRDSATPVFLFFLSVQVFFLLYNASECWSFFQVVIEETQKLTAGSQLHCWHRSPPECLQRAEISCRPQKKTPVGNSRRTSSTKVNVRTASNHESCICWRTRTWPR